MPYYRTGVLQDAYIRHEGVVEADTPEQAVDAAYDQWIGRREDITLVEGDSQGYDHADRIDLSEVEEITKEKYETELAEARLAVGAPSDLVRKIQLQMRMSQILDLTSGERHTVTPENAFEHFQKLNRILVDVREIAKAALEGV